jgi:hypothetical protein
MRVCGAADKPVALSQRKKQAPLLHWNDARLIGVVRKQGSTAPARTR